MTSQDGWTVPDALAQFAAAGMPLDETGFRAVVRAAARLGTLHRAGEMQSGPKGGRGTIQYDIGGLQRLHSALAPWLVAKEPAEGALRSFPGAVIRQPRPRVCKVSSTDDTRRRDSPCSHAR